MTDTLDPRHAALLAEARQQLERDSVGAPTWPEVTEHERVRASLEARKMLMAAQVAGLVPAPLPAGHVLGHWKARYKVQYTDEPDRSRTYEAWIGASDPDEARALLAKRLTDPDIAGWDLVELNEATAGEPDVIATLES